MVRATAVWRPHPSATPYLDLSSSVGLLLVGAGALRNTGGGVFPSTPWIRVGGSYDDGFDTSRTGTSPPWGCYGVIHHSLTAASVVSAVSHPLGIINRQQVRFGHPVTALSHPTTLYFYLHFL